ncbi:MULTISPECIES: GNAT family N-acetyltransferase [unclassified Streptomyces]|uniref:GNAT family N-acetyltransferase n=1 Tax=unclassified Streptomyces TaxID=2593676 RepID=UPI001BE8F229|nr:MULTISPECIES: GNAT family N-acetyltransferase [unclassified Streptomyces]MBT2407086.1 GNAT family N-acetyltransferase [Streptomyces sp. ISL-21]MBT2455915.1 GNAT family N-acetyltransferase [Streptomyces sp. ISL-86]MBT2613214.1 GNAT family N-acetyltransferase [Streptomyces sp. ISL-87]
MILQPLVPVDGALPGPVLTEIATLYATNHAFFELTGDFPDPARITVEQVAAALADELAHEGAQVLMARSAGRLVGLAATLDRHPDPASGDPDPWIGLLLIDATAHREGYGRTVAALVEDRFRAAGRTGVRLAVLDNNPKGLAFWQAQGYETLRHAEDLELRRPCTVLRKPL